MKRNTSNKNGSLYHKKYLFGVVSKSKIIYLITLGSNMEGYKQSEWSVFFKYSCIN